jgi:hypothetical protein
MRFARPGHRLRPRRRPCEEAERFGEAIVLFDRTRADRGGLLSVAAIIQLRCLYRDSGPPQRVASAYGWLACLSFITSSES